MSANIREILFNHLLGDAQFVSIFGDSQLARDGVYPAPVDSPAGERWIVLTWRDSSPPIGRDSDARVQNLTIWAYDRGMGYGWIDLAIKSIRISLALMEGVSQGGCSVISVIDDGAGPDQYDDVYAATLRTVTFRIAGVGL